MVYIRQALGFMPTDSLVLITVDHHQLTSVLRVNLLPTDASDEQVRDFLRHLKDTCKPLRNAQQLIAVVFAEYMWGLHQEAAAYANIARFGKELLPISHAYYVCPQFISTLFPGAEDRQPLTEQIMDSTELCAQLAVAGFSSAGTAAQQVERMVVAPWPNQSALRSSAVKSSIRKQQHEEQLNFDVTHARYLFERLAHWDRWIREVAQTGQAGRRDKNAAMIRHCPQEALELVTDLEHVRTRDLVLVLASFPLMHTVVGAYQHFFTEAVQNEFFRTLPAEHVDAQVPDEVFRINFLSNALMASAEIDPDWGRTTALNALLRELLPLAAKDSRQAILGLLAWTEWSMGRATLALVYLDKATAEDPGYRFSVLFSTLLNTGKVAAWAIRKHH